MRIAQVVEASGGGTGRHVIDLTSGLARTGHDVTLIYSPLRIEPQFAEGLKGLDVDLHTAPFRRELGSHDLAHVRLLARILRDAGPFDVVHGHSSKAGALVRLLPGSVPGRRVYTPHAIRMLDPTLTPGRRRFYATLERMLATRPSLFVAGSAEEVGCLRGIGIADERIVLLDFGIGPGPNVTRSEARARHGLPQDASVIGFVGRLVPQKAPERAIRALGRAGRTDLHMALVGMGNLEPFLRDLAVREGVADRVRFLGPANGQAAMPAFDVLVMPSRYDTIPYVLLEAVMAGVPVVGSPVGAVERVVGEGGAGIVVPNTDDPEPWAGAIRDIFEPTRLEAARAATERLQSLHSLEHMVRQMEGIYERLAGADRPNGGAR